MPAHRLEEKAAAVGRMTKAIMIAIDDCGGFTDLAVVMASLGTTIGAIADATDSPDTCLAHTLYVARCYVNGSFSDAEAKNADRPN